MAQFNFRDKSRTESGNRQKRRNKVIGPPKTGNAKDLWVWQTREMLESLAFRSLSINAYRAFNRIKLEHLMHGMTENGNLCVTHLNFKDFGVNPNFTADAIDELQFKGLIKVQRGIAADGSSHPNRFRLTMYGTREGGAPTNDWKRCSAELLARWKPVRGKLKATE